MQTLALIDYGSGNLPSADKALRKAAAAGARPTCVVTTADPDRIAAADRIVLPGVGAFGACIAALRARKGVVEALEEAVRRRGAPFLGICVGMQLLAETGLEFGVTPGLGWCAGEVRRLDRRSGGAKIPHMGWNTLEPLRDSPLLANLPDDVHMYFTHSFAFWPADPQVRLAETPHGGRFVSAVEQGNIAGVQFHPEKSQAAGAQLLSNFLAWSP